MIVVRHGRSPRSWLIQSTRGRRRTPTPRRKIVPPGEDPADWPTVEECLFDEEDLAIFDRLREQEQAARVVAKSATPVPPARSDPSIDAIRAIGQTGPFLVGLAEDGLAGLELDGDVTQDPGRFGAGLERDAALGSDRDRRSWRVSLVPSYRSRPGSPALNPGL